MRPPALPLAYLFVGPDDPDRQAYIKELLPVAKKHKGVVNFVWIDAGEICRACQRA
jgi:protein disulfide-isomerase A1